MRKETVVYEVYKFEELSREAKDKAIQRWYENEDYPFLNDDLTEELKYWLNEEKIEIVDGLKMYYSLSYCQGDGFCFIGTFKYDDFYVHITHVGNYYHKRSVNFEFENELGEEDNCGNDKGIRNFLDLYRAICDKLEKYGYDILEYRMNDEEFAEMSESNEYEYHANGNRY